MKLQQSQSLAQKMLLTPSMRQALVCLQMPITDLQAYIQEAALSNPVLEVNDTAFYESPLPQNTQVSVREESTWYSSESTEETTDPFAYCQQEQTFSDYLHQQVGQTKLIDHSLRGICDFIIDCLDRRGYLDCPLEELAQEYGCDTALMEQGLYAVQMLDPLGVGARNLSECLMLQLAQSKQFTALSIRIIQNGLELLAQNDYETLARRYNASVAEVARSAALIRSFHPIPSRGFSDGQVAVFMAPEAQIYAEENRLVVVLNTRALDQITISPEYRRLLHETTDKQTKQYLRQKITEASSLIDNVRARNQTLYQLLTALVSIQHDYFFGGELRTYTMQQMAEALGVSTSTVSRTVRDKTIQYDGRILSLRDFFTTPLRNSKTAPISPHEVKQRLRVFLENEDSSAPLTDEALHLAFCASGINISRRTIAKYRTELGFQTAGKRRSKAGNPRTTTQ